MKSLKIGDSPETRDRSQRAAAERLWNKETRKQRERGRASQWKSTHERGAETLEVREKKNGSSAIRHFERGDEDVTE